ncbi:hypothetical protein DBA57_30685 [Bacillus anthracis]|nr:hypothetical protein DBA57_30685 [Bacillus anthracis]
MYRQEGNLDTIDITNPQNLISRKGIESGKEFIDRNIEPNKTYTYAITVIDNASVENEAKIFNKEVLDNENAALPIIDAINKIPSLDSLTLDDELLVTSARALVSAFNNDSYVTNLDVLVAAENKIAQLKEEKAKEEQIAKENAAISAIDRLPALESITLDDEASIKAARKLVTIANNDSAITNLDKLVKAEAKIKELKENSNINPGENNNNNNNNHSNNNNNNNNNNKDGKLPDTGGKNSSILLIFASMLTIAGTTLFRKNK